MLLSVVLKRRKNKEKEAGNGPENVSFQCRTSNSFFLCYCNYVRAEDSFVHLNVINRQRQRQQNRKANYMPGPTTRTPQMPPQARFQASVQILLERWSMLFNALPAKFSATRCWNKKLPNFSKNSHSSFYLKSDFFKMDQKLQNIWITLVRKCVAKNFQKSPNLVTLQPINKRLEHCCLCKL